MDKATDPKKKKKEKKKKREKDKDLLQEVEETKNTANVVEQSNIDSVEDYNINNQKIVNTTEIINSEELNNITGNFYAKSKQKKSKKRKSVDFLTENDVNNSNQNPALEEIPAKSKKKKKDNLNENARDVDETNYTVHESVLDMSPTKLKQNKEANTIENLKDSNEVSDLERTSHVKISPTKSKKKKKKDKTVEEKNYSSAVNSIVENSELNQSPTKSPEKRKIDVLIESIKDINEVNNTIIEETIKSKKKKKHKNKDKDAVISNDLTENKDKSMTENIEINMDIETKLQDSENKNSENMISEVINIKKSKKKKKHSKENIVQNSDSEKLENHSNSFIEGNEKKKKHKHKHKEKSDVLLFNLYPFNSNDKSAIDLQRPDDKLLDKSNKLQNPYSENLNTKLTLNETNAESNSVTTDVTTGSSKNTKKKKKKDKKKSKTKNEDDSNLKKKHKKNKKMKKEHSKLNPGVVSKELIETVSIEEQNKKSDEIEDWYNENLFSNEEDDNQDYFYNFEEEELDFEPPILHGNGYPSTLTKQQKERLTVLGVKFRMGTWSKTEDQILIRNWDNLIEKYELKKPYVLLGLTLKKLHTGVQKFIRAKKFYFQLAKDLNERTIHSCYLRARKLFHPYRDADRKGWMGTPKEEVEDLQALVAIYGNKWTKVGQLVHRDGKNISEIIRYHRKNAVKGHWSAEEDENLIEAIKSVLQIDDVAGIYYGIQWEEVAKLVPTRNAVQCRQHWLLNTCWKINNDRPRSRWKDTDTIRLIYHLYRLPTDNELDIDWNELTFQFDNVASYATLKQKWFFLKQKVPGYQNKDYEDIITYLYRCYLPSLLDRVGKSYIEEIIETL